MMMQTCETCFNVFKTELLVNITVVAKMMVLNVSGG